MMGTEPSATATPAPWYPFGLVGLLGVSGTLTLTHLDREGLGYPNYAATVLSMGHSWHNFWYASFDPAGFLAVDKPPLGLWVQTLFTRLLGFNSWGLLAPQAVATIASVLLLATLVRRSHGPLAGILSGLFLALCPISVAVGRTNLVDSQLVLALLLSAWAVLHLMEGGGWRWVMGTGLLLGAALLIKGAQTLLIAPALLLPVLFVSTLSPRRRLLVISLVCLLAAAVALAWIVAVDRTPATHRPYVGGSPVNSEWNLLVQFNGAERLSGTANFAPTVGPAARWPGPAGPLRFLDRQLGDQISWLLPLACVGVVLGRGRTRRTRSAWWLWAGWAIGPLVLFSVLSAYLPYYVATMAPGLAALQGIGLAALWERYRHGSIRPRQLVLVPACTALTQLTLLRGFSSWHPWLRSCLVLLVLVGCVLILASWRPAAYQTTWLVAFGGVFAVVGLLAAPFVWSLTPVLDGLVYRDMPYAGPLPASAISTHHAAGPDDAAMVRFLRSTQGRSRFLLAAPDAYVASPFILATGRPVLTIGGYTGDDPTLTLQQLGTLIGSGAVRYFLVPSTPLLPLAPGHGPTGPAQLWQAVTAACTAVPPTTWHAAADDTASRTTPTHQTDRYPGYGWDMVTGVTLYDCSPSGI